MTGDGPRGDLGLWVELTERCQLKCRFCYNGWRAAPPASHADMRERTAGDLLRFVDAARETRRLSVTLAGGDPTAFAGLGDLLGRLASDVPLTLVTHGADLPEAVVERLAERGRARIQFSIPSLLEAEYRFLTGGGSLAAALRGVALAMRRGVPRSVSAVITRRNAASAVELAAFAACARADHLLLNRFLASGRGALHDNAFGLCAARFAEAAEAVAAAAEAHGLPVLVSGALPGIRRRKATDLQVTVKPDGALSLCSMADSVIGALGDPPEAVAERAASFWRSSAAVAGCHCAQASP